MISPDHKPLATQAKAYHLVHSTKTVEIVVSVIKMVLNEKTSGKTSRSGMMAPVIKTVEIMSYHLTVFSTFSWLTLKRLVVAKN